MNSLIVIAPFKGIIYIFVDTSDVSAAIHFGAT